MDLKGSLVDTNLKIYPTTKLLDFLKKIDGNHLDIPENIQKFLSDGNSLKKSNKTVKPSNVYLSNEEINHLNKIKEHFKEKDTKDDGERHEKKSESEFQTTNEPHHKTHISSSSSSDTEKEENDDESSSSDDENEQSKTSDPEVEKDNTNKKEKKTKLNKEKKAEKPFLLTSDIDWLYEYLQKRIKNGEKDIPFMHTLLENCSIKLPKNKLIKRNPELEARCVKLRAQQEAREYRKMTKGVDNVRIRYPEDSIAFQLKSMNRQLIAIGQFIISIFAGFLFGFRGVEWMVGNLDFGFRLLLGVMCALIIALAEIYFLAKKLNEELQMTETIQIGGPPKFADPPLRKFHDPEVLEKVLKEHVD